ncbi:MAG: hypothetical protein IJ773_07040 [Lachnospiraceae bacterium]|nr:hypothetical protein [Lachnospiraceae bacterium]
MSQQQMKKGKQTGGWIFRLLAVFAGVASLILFFLTREAEFTRQMIETYHQDIYVMVALGIGILFSICSLAGKGKMSGYLSFLAFLFAFLNDLVFEADYLGSLFSSIDPTELTAEFVVLTALLFAATLLAFLGAACKPEPEMGGGEEV